MVDAIRLNIGGGQTVLPGFTVVDRASGSEAYPLAYPDESVDEIYASHVLEHFGHDVARAVLTDWVRTLKPGGRIRLAVPDFAWVCNEYAARRPVNIQGLVMGGRRDANDAHGAIYDEGSLSRLMLDCGLTGVRRWTPNDLGSDWAGKDCSSLECSLNLEADKPGPGTVDDIRDVYAIMSAPRFGPTMHARCAFLALGELGIPYCVGSGAYWHQVLTHLIEDGVRQMRRRGANPKWVLTFDYDTIFDAETVRELYRCAHLVADLDAVTALQMKRASDSALFSVAGPDGKPLPLIDAAVFQSRLMPVMTGHFGMTMIRVESLLSLPHPWFAAKPDATGRWCGPEKVDADVAFWLKWREHGRSLYLAPQVAIGHLQEVVTWPRLRTTADGGMELWADHRTLDEYETGGRPAL